MFAMSSTELSSGERGRIDAKLAVEVVTPEVTAQRRLGEPEPLWQGHRYDCWLTTKGAPLRAEGSLPNLAQSGGTMRVCSLHRVSLPTAVPTTQRRPRNAMGKPSGLGGRMSSRRPCRAVRV
jgi:hypothetical protein